MANKRIAGITVEIGADTTQLGKALDDVEKKSRSIKNELKEVDRALQLNPGNTELLAQKQRLLADAVQAAREKLDTLRHAQEQVSQQFSRGEIDEGQYRAFQREVSNAEAELHRLEAQAEEASQATSEIGNTASISGEKFQKFGDKVSAVGEKLSVVSAGIAAVSGAAVKMWSDNEDAYAKLSTIADTEEMSMEELANSIRELSKETGIAEKDITENVYNAISAGQATADSVAFVSNATKLAKAGFTDSASALDILTTILNAYGLESQEVARVSDVLINTQNLGKTTVAELSAAMGKAIPTARANNVSIENLASMYAVMTANGIKTAESTTYLNSMMNELGKQGSKAYDAFAKGTEHIKEGGLNMAEAMEMGWDLTDVLSILDEQAAESGTTINNMFGSAEAGKAANVLWSNASKLNDVVASMSDSSGATDAAFAKMNTTSNKVKITVNQLKLALTDLADVGMRVLQPVLDKVRAIIEKVTEKISSLTDEQKQTILTIVGVVAAIGPALVIIGKVISLIGTVIETVKTVKTAITALNATLLANPLALIVAAIAAVIAILVVLYNKSDTFRNFVNAFFKKLKEHFDNAVAWFKKLAEDFKALLTTIKNAFEKAWDKIKSVWNAATGFFQNVRDGINRVFENVAQWFHDRFRDAYDRITGVFSAIGGFFVDRYNDVQNAFSSVATFFHDKFTDAFNAIKNVFSGIRQFFEGIWDTIKDVFGSVGTKIGDAFSGGFKGVVNTIFEWVEQKINDVFDMINGAIDFINEVPGVNIGKINHVSLPRLAKGGVLSEGSAIVAEAGPELLSVLNGKVTVTPLSDSARNSASGGASNVTNNYYTTNNVSATIKNDYDVRKLSQQLGSLTKQTAFGKGA